MQLYSITDPISATMAAVKALQAYRRQQEATLKPLVEFEDDAQEARWQASKGLPPRTSRQRIQATIGALSKTRRHFAELDPNADPLVFEILSEVEHAPQWAESEAKNRIARIVQGLTGGEVDLMTRVLALDDIVKDVEAGLYGEPDAEGVLPREAPFGFTTVDAIQAALREARRAAGQPVTAAIARRQRFAQALTSRLVSLNLLPASVLKDPRYYHRQVLEYATPQPGIGTSSKDVRVHRKGFQRHRVGGGDFNTRYQEAEFEWMAQAITLIHLRQSLDQIQAIADLTSTLKQEAKALNLGRFYAAKGARPGEVMGDDPLQPFKQRIARGSQEIITAVANGHITAEDVGPRLASVLEELADQYLAWERSQRGVPAKERAAFQFGHPGWWALLKHLLETGGDGAQSAGMIFKAIHEREHLIAETLGRQYLDPSNPEDLTRLAPEGYRAWQPERGNYMFRALTLANEGIDAVLPDVVPSAEMREAMVLGGPKPTWIIPEGLAHTLDNFRDKHSRWVLERGWVRTMGYVKIFLLLAPNRILKYNLNNLSGDLDAALLYPGILKYAKQAAGDVRRYLYDPTSLTAAEAKELSTLHRRRVIDNTLSLEELPDLNKLPEFQRLVEGSPFDFMRLVQSYWRHAKQLTQWRENILRLAAARYFAAQLASGRTDIYGASNPKRVEAAQSHEERAAVLARDLIGDYGTVSEAGQWLRNRLFPFWSWVEINSKRYMWIFRNIPREGGGLGRGAGAAVGLGLRGAKTLVQVHLFFALVHAWNRLFFADEDDELRREGRNLHLILGRRADGRVVSIRLEGAWADFLEWLNLQDWPSDVADLWKGDATIEDKFADAARAPIERLANMWDPITKTVLETAIRIQTYPSVFKPRPVRERAEHVLRLFGMNNLYRKITDRPVPAGGLARALLVYQTDPGEAAYYSIREDVLDFLKERGRSSGVVVEPTERGNALYYARMASRWGEVAQSQRWYQRYLALGGTPDGFRRSIERAEPLAALPAKERARFYRQITPEQRASLREAETWDRRVWLRPSRQAIRRPPLQKVAP